MTRYLLACLLALPSSVWAQARKSGDTPSAPVTAKETWVIDTSRSKVGFDLRLFAGRSDGEFQSWAGTISMPPGKWEDAAVDVVIQAASVHTDEEDRDKHLRTADFFDVAKYPVITFKSTKITRDGDSVAIAGNLTIKNVTKPVVLKGKYVGGTSGPTPEMKFQASVIVNRMDYGVNYESILVRDGIVLGEDVTIAIALTAVRR